MCEFLTLKAPPLGTVSLAVFSDHQRADVDDQPAIFSTELGYHLGILHTVPQVATKAYSGTQAETHLSFIDYMFKHFKNWQLL